ncbi:MAG TPA: PspC domain-containing protein [Acidimicrobiales bacterium]|nr:PspC domain-containing protein [Acidimicrobiales bacterium]
MVDETEPEDEPPPPRRPARLLERGPDRYLGGVASGVARAFDVDPLVVRVALVAVALYMPPSVVLYALAWLVLPDQRTHRSLLSAAVGGHDVAPALGVAALGLGAAVLAPELGPGGDGGLTFGVVLLGLGFLLVTGRVGTRSEPPGPPWSDPPPPPRSDAPPPPSSGSPPPPVPSPPRQKAYLGWFGISALVLLVGGLAAADQGWEPVQPGVAVSLGLLLLGAVLCVAAWRGRARVLLPVGVVLLPLWIGLSASDVPRFEGDGDVQRVVAADEPLPAALRHGYGNLTVDLTAADFPAGERQRIYVGLTAGRVFLRVPRDVHLDIRGDVGMGTVDVFDGWQVGDSGPYLLQEVDRTLGEPRDLCQSYETYEEPPLPSISSLVEQPGEPTTSTTTTTVEYFDTTTGDPCTPAQPLENPAELELVLDVGIGIVEVHRDPT